MDTMEDTDTTDTVFGDVRGGKLVLSPLLSLLLLLMLIPGCIMVATTED